ncbi:3185_t:CDS:1 [Paraglomus occultum]|uniref:3185_t:CDS:1 n=1 Tax=Paraglomus occultum TaxID=144539 RepID=A0A9N8WG58_9GLOM|nr:3185_t:CDS:1 [Paraglomus occultum]
METIQLKYSKNYRWTASNILSQKRHGSLEEHCLLSGKQYNRYRTTMLYVHLGSTITIVVPVKFPYIASFKLVDGQCEEVSFDYEEKLAGGKFVYIIRVAARKDIPERLLVKFVTSYGLDIHQFCAERGFAPKLYGHQNINSDWKMVVMEYLPDYKMIADPPRTRNTAKNLNSHWTLGLTY